MSQLEETLALHLKAAKIKMEREHKFHPTRRWRFDFAHVGKMLAVECEGGVWSGGRHTRGSGFVADMEKYNAATVMGWRVLRFSGEQIKNGEALRTIEAAIGNQGRA